jgi:hypothetical protein
MASNQIPGSSSQPGEESTRKLGLERVTRLLTSQYEKTVGVIMKSAKNRKPQGFPKFAKLPEELQLKIWQFAALLPRVVKLRMATTKKFGRTTYYRWRIIDYSGVHPLLVTTFTSRQIALATLGDGYSVDRVRTLNDDESICTCYTIRYNPLNDTIFVANVDSLDVLSRCYHICPKARPLSKAGLTVVRSLALNGLWLPASHPIAYDITRESSSQFRSVRRFLGAAVDFPALEELILVDPITAQETTSHNFRGRQVQKLVPLSKEGHENLFNVLLDLLSQQLKEGMQRSGNMSHGWIPTAISSWWENPKFTVMTKEEFKAHFNES